VSDDWLRFTQSYAEWRSRWEYGDVAAFVAWLAGFCALLLPLARPPAADGPSRPRA
jgi:hypothetical protein